MVADIISRVRHDSPSDSATVLAVPESAIFPAFVTVVLESRTFEKAPTLRALLRYLWQYRDEPISEYAVATGALGRSALFNAKIDATVRVQISRLRQRLEKFYEQEGMECSERLVVPLGSHQIRVESIVRVPAVRQLDLAEKKVNTKATYLIVICVALAVVCGALAMLLLRSKTSNLVAAQETPRFWKSFFGATRGARIIMPTPVFFSFAPAGSVESMMFRDTNVNEFGDLHRSPLAGTLTNAMGAPRLAQNYTVASDTFASVKLVRYLDRSHLETSVRSSADSPLEALDTENVVALGTWGTLTPLKSYLDQMNYVLGPHEQWVDVRRPVTGQPKRIEGVAESDQRFIWPGVIAVLPGRGGRTQLLILASRHTAALVSFLTSTAGLEQLEHLWVANGSPKYYEVVVKSEMNGDDLVRFWPVAMHPVQVTARN